MGSDQSIEKQIFWCIAFSSFVFVSSVIFGFVIASVNFEDAENIVREVTSQFGYIKDLNVFSIFLYIFFNNSIKGFLAMLSGTFFGIFPFVFLFSNGEFIGLILGLGETASVTFRIMIGLLPHGILEIPAIILSASYGFWLGYRFFKFLVFREPFKEYFILAVRKYVRIVLPLLFLAALIETFVTPAVIKMVR